MIGDDKIGIVWGRLAPMDEFGGFDGKVWTLDELKAKTEFEAAAKAGANTVRIMPYGVWGPHPKGNKAYQFQPYVLNTAKDKWDLSTFNGYYFPIMKKIFTLANGVGLTVLFDLFDNCEFHGAYAKYSPWFSNVQGLISFYGKDADAFSSEWVRLITFRFKDFDIMWSFGNEMNNQSFPDFAKRVIFPKIKLRKLDFNRMTYGATMMKRKYLGNNQYDDAGYCPLDFVKKDVGLVFGDEAKLDMYREIHGCGGAREGPERPFGADVDQALWGWGNNPIRKIFSDDGCYSGDSKCDLRPGKGARPSAETWGKMATYILKNYPSVKGGRDRLINFEHLPAGFSTGSLECKVAPIKAISAAYRARFGIWPKNYKP